MIFLHNLQIPSTLIILLPQHIGNTKKVIPTIHIDVGPFIEHGNQYY